MAHLHLSLNKDGNIIIKPIGEITENQWLTVQLWWQSPLRQSNNSDEIEVTISDFLLKSEWLRENWRANHNTITYDNDVLSAVKEKRQLADRFTDLCEGEYELQTIDFSELKLKRQPKGFQQNNIQRLLSLSNGANFSVPGAGKTSTALIVWEILRSQDKLTHLLVMCPRSAFTAWESEPAKTLNTDVITHEFNDEGIPNSANLVYCNYERIEDKTRLRRLVSWISNKKVLLILDEAHRIKGGQGSVRWNGCLQLASRSSRVDILTGTPMPQGPEDLRNLFAICWPSVPISYFNESRLKSLKRGGIFVRTTKSELNLPIPKIIEENIPMGVIQTEIYKALKRRFLKSNIPAVRENAFFNQKGKAVMSLLGAATNPGLLLTGTSEDSYIGFRWPPKELNDSKSLMRLVEEYAAHEISPKYQWILRFVAHAHQKNNKVLIWSTFVGNILALKKLLKNYRPAVIYGSISSDERKIELNRFQNTSDCNVLITNPQTLGEGISLHEECHTAIYVDRNYNAGQYLQSLDRIHRLGLSKDTETNIYILKSVGSIDSSVSDRLNFKIDRLGQYLEDPGLKATSIPDDDLTLDTFTALGMDLQDIDSLLAHLENE